MGKGMTTIRIAIGDYPHTLPLKRGEIKSEWLKLDFHDVKPVHHIFKPMIREHAYDAGEMALTAFFTAKDYDKGLRLLPAAMLARFQHNAMLYNSARGTIAPRDLAGKRIGIRSWNQTTAAWLRGILADDYGVDFSGVKWFTFEDGHVAEAQDPPGVVRATKDMTQMLQDGDLDAAIYGAAMPDDPRLKSVIADPVGDSSTWYAKHKFVPVNHMVVVTDELAREQPKAVAELYRLLEASRNAAPPKGDVDTVPFGKDANRKCMELLMSYAVQQQLVRKPIPIDSLY